MAGLRIGIDVGGTFTHGVVLRPPGAVIARARTATTHTHQLGVAAGVQDVLRKLLVEVDAAEVELVAHSTTQATNALLEGDVSPVCRVVIVPPGEGLLVRQSLRGGSLDLGGGHALAQKTTSIPWQVVADRSCLAGLLDTAAHAAPGQPVAVIQPLAGKQDNREGLIAGWFSAHGRQVVQAGDITQVLGLTARARTAVVNASMLPTMLATADFTEHAVAELLPDVPLQVVRSDGGAMSIDEMRRQPIQSLLSGPAAGASAALSRTGLSEVVFIEVGGTSTDITLISEGRVRHRHATVGGHQLMVPALDLRTVAVGGGSMLRANGSGFGPRSAHIAGLPYLFQAVAEGKRVSGHSVWRGADGRSEYTVAAMTDGTTAALTLTDYWLLLSGETLHDPGLDEAGVQLAQPAAAGITLPDAGGRKSPVNQTVRRVLDAIHDLARAHRVDLAHFRFVFGGGGAPALRHFLAPELPGASSIVDDHAVISAIGAALAVTCVSLSKSVADPNGSDIAELTRQVEQRLRAQGAERVGTDYEYDPQRQILTVTGRGSRAYEQQAKALSAAELATVAAELVKGDAEVVWQCDTAQLWRGSGGPRRGLACVLDHCGRSLWLGHLLEWFPADGASRQAQLDDIIDRRTAYTDGGPALPGLGLVCDGRFIPLDQLGSRELISEVLRWENLPVQASACFIIRS